MRPLKHYWDSVWTISYWRYALFSAEAAAKILACMGGLYLLVELLDTFQIYSKDKYSEYGLIVMLALSILYVLTTRRPVSRIRYKPPGKDLTFAVEIGDLLSQPGEIIISTNTTFDTDMASGLIAAESLQGQLATRFFIGKTDEIDRQIAVSLEGVPFTENDARPGKKKEYPLGTVAKINAHGKNFYLVAMAHLNAQGTAHTDVKMLDEALENMWKNMAERAELGDIYISIMGTGRGRVKLPRKKVIEKIAQSFADASQKTVFSNKLTIVIRPDDASNFSINLFQVRDYLSQSLHV